MAAKIILILGPDRLTLTWSKFKMNYGTNGIVRHDDLTRCLLKGEGSSPKAHILRLRMIIYRNRSKPNTRPEYSAAGEQIDRVEVELFAESSPKDETSQKAKPRYRIYLASQACRIRGLV